MKSFWKNALGSNLKTIRQKMNTLSIHETREIIMNFRRAIIYHNSTSSLPNIIPTRLCKWPHEIVYALVIFTLRATANKNGFSGWFFASKCFLQSGLFTIYILTYFLSVNNFSILVYALVIFTLRATANKMASLGGFTPLNVSCKADCLQYIFWHIFYPLIIFQFWYPSSNAYHGITVFESTH